MSESNNTPQKNGRGRSKRKTGTDLTYTTIQIKHVHNTRESLQLSQQVLDSMNKALLWIEIALDRIDSEMIDLSKFSEDMTGAVVYGQLIESFEARIQSISSEMDNEISKLAKMRNDNRINIEANHKNPREQTIEANNSVVAQYLHLLSKYDEIVEETFVLNFAGILSRFQRKELVELYKKKLRKMARTIIEVNQEAQKRVQASKQRETAKHDQRRKQTQKQAKKSEPKAKDIDKIDSSDAETQSAPIESKGDAEVSKKLGDQEEASSAPDAA